MKPLLTSLLLAASLSATASPVLEMRLQPTATQPYTVTKQSQFPESLHALTRLPDRPVDYPTQIVRIKGDVRHLDWPCGAVLQQIGDFFTDMLVQSHFYYTTLVNCWFDPKTEAAVGYSIDSYFDPVDQAAWERLEAFKANYQGKDFLGTPFRIETAKGLAVSLNLDAGMMEHPDDSVFMRLRRDNNTLYFENHYRMIGTLLQDVRTRFFSHEQSMVIPFLQAWLLPHADSMYPALLRRSNTVLLQPERIFLMESGPAVYTSPLRMYFAHHCEKYPNQRCL